MALKPFYKIQRKHFFMPLCFQKQKKMNTVNYAKKRTVTKKRKFYKKQNQISEASLVHPFEIQPYFHSSDCQKHSKWSQLS